jgi:hypothetical protein
MSPMGDGALIDCASFTTWWWKFSAITRSDGSAEDRERNCGLVVTWLPAQTDAARAVGQQGTAGSDAPYYQTMQRSRAAVCWTEGSRSKRALWIRRVARKSQVRCGLQL